MSPTSNPLRKKKKNYWNVQQSHTGKKQANAIVIHWQHHVEVFSRILWRLSLNEKKSLAEKVQCSKEKKALGFKLFDWWYLKYYNSSQKCHPRSLVNLPCFIFTFISLLPLEMTPKHKQLLHLFGITQCCYCITNVVVREQKKKKKNLKIYFLSFSKIVRKETTLHHCVCSGLLPLSLNVCKVCDGHCTDKGGVYCTLRFNNKCNCGVLWLVLASCRFITQC